MAKKFLLLLPLLLMFLIPAGTLSAQGPTRTPTSALGGFFGEAQTSGTSTPTPANDPVKQALAKDNYVVLTSGAWYDATGKPAADSAHVLMLGASPDPKSTIGVKQILSGFAALRAAFPSAASYQVLLLSGPNIYNASTTANSLQLLSTNLLSSDAFISEVTNGMKTISLVTGSTSPATATPTRTATNRPPTAVSTRVPTQRPTVVPTRVPTRRPTVPVDTCGAPAGQARLRVKNGYSGVMRFSVGAPDVGFQKDYDIPSDGIFHFIDMPPSSKYTYSASIPGVGKASAKIPTMVAGQCFDLTFQP